MSEPCGAARESTSGPSRVRTLRRPTTRMVVVAAASSEGPLPEPAVDVEPGVVAPARFFISARHDSPDGSVSRLPF